MNIAKKIQVYNALESEIGKVNSTMLIESIDEKVGHRDQSMKLENRQFLTKADLKLTILEYKIKFLKFLIVCFIVTSYAILALLIYLKH